jgi:glycosyltransferase involved in cell wall biosynthesis
VTRRLLFCTQTAHPHGGLETWLDEIVPFLEGRGWQVIVGLARGRRFHDPAAYRAAHPRLQRTIELDGRWQTRESRVAALRRAFREVRPDVVVPVNIGDTLEAVAREKLERSPLRLVTMLRAQEPYGELEDVRIYRDFIDVAVGGNRLLRALLAEWSGVAEERLRYIPPGSRRKTAGGDRRAERQPGAALLATARPLRLGYVGRLDQRDKRVLELADVVRLLDREAVPFELTIAGDGPDRAELERALAGRARFLGNVAVDELYASVYPNLDVLLLFSEAEAGPQVVWQAMHYGVVPVVSRYRGAAAEGVLRNGDTALLFDVGDVIGAAAAVARLAADEMLLRRIAHAAERAVDPDYLLDASFERWLAVFEEARTIGPAVGRALPAAALASSGALERLHIPPPLAHGVRRLMGRAHEATEPGGEWPHHHGVDAATRVRIDVLARELDR